MSMYTEAVEQGLKGLNAPAIGHCKDCPECIENDPEGYDEGSFSSSGCGICGSSLGGDNYVWHWLDDAGSLMHEDDSCTDCVQFMANGTEPDAS